MAARNPTAFIAYCEELLLQPRSRILTSEIDDVADQQRFVFDRQEPVLSEFFPAVTTTSGAFVTAMIAEVRVKDQCNDPFAASTVNWACSAYAWAGAGVTSFEVKVLNNDAVTTFTQTITTSLTSQIWRPFQNLASRIGNHADTIEIQIRVAGGAGNVYLGGFAIFAPET